MLLRRPFLLPVLAVACLLAGLGDNALAPAPADQRATTAPAGSPLYVALGDSLAAGWQPDAHGHDRSTQHGYVQVVARSLARSHPGLTSRTMSCGGATAGTLLHGGAGCQPRGEHSQVERAEELLAASPGTVLVTVNIGDNDIEACIDGNTGAVNRRCLAHGEAQLRRNLPQIAARLRTAAPPSAPVVGLVDYDQFLSLWLNGPRGRAAARRSLPIIASLNRLAAGIYRKAGLQVADATARFDTNDFTHRRTLAGHGSVPLAVYKICTLTWACSPAPIGHDDHARPSGYYELAQSILDVLRAAR
jgi:lysophospholipase L1-like esterase